ncbi:MAG: M23 family metallopeptidase [Thermodesulfovibrionia bacterium]|nr:M23 family metallopeptidase [Thermodesulfovibrionia bacterium]
MSGYVSKSSGGIFKKLSITVVLLFILLAIGYAAYKLFFIPAPVIEGTDAFKFISSNKTVVLNAKNLKSIVISISQNGKTAELLRDVTPISDKKYSIQVKTKELQLSDGPAKISIVASSGGFREAKQEIDSVIDTTPPTLDVLMSPYMVTVGGGGFIAVKSKDADAVFVRLKDYRFEGYKAADNPGADGAFEYYIFFPVLLDIVEGGTIHAVAEDMAGNQRVRAVDTKIIGKTYSASSINISDTFINTAVVSILNITSTSDPVGSFKEVNEKMRAENVAKLREIAKVTESKMLWEGNFLQMKNSQVMAKYGDKRDYIYNGRKISESVHLGYDLAANANSPVEAANTGIVRFAGDLGIYGNTVAIDHGMALMSIYSHLSEIMVKEGDEVKKGAVIARSGATGFAGGDHLHFGILIHGHETSPIFWWDTHWLKVNIFDYLEKGNPQT